MASIGISIEPNPKKREEKGVDAKPSDQTNGWTRSFDARTLSIATSSGSTTPRSRQSSPRNGVMERLGLAPESKQRGRRVGKVWYRKRVKGVVVGLLACFLVMNWWMLSRIQDSNNRGFGYGFLRANSSTLSIREELIKLGKVKRPQKTIYAKLLAKAVHALAENKPEPRELWVEPFVLASSWRPCADQRNWEPSGGENGYILVSANGGINQQRVAVCNAVAVTRLLNATLVVPKFLYSSVWRDPRNFRRSYSH